MKKYLVVTLLASLLLTSCGKKVEETKNEETSTSKIETSSSKVETSTQELEETKETSTSKVEEKVEDNKTSETKKEGLETYLSEKGYEVTYNSKLKKEEAEGMVMILNEANESVSVIAEDYSKANFADFKAYVDFSVKNVETALKVKNLKREEIILNGKKGEKISYPMEFNGEKFFIEQFVFSNDKKVAFVVTKTLLSEKENEDLKAIVDSFKITK